MARLPVGQINPHTDSTLRIAPETRVASGGSCFAQNITTALQKRGYNYFVTEAAPPFLSSELAKRYNYGVFSARYGNLYTPLQLLQLLQRAFEGFTPVDQIWTDANGRFYDLLRPRIAPSGFSSIAEIQSDIRQHLVAVQKLFRDVEVYVFTLGLTEGWVSAKDGTIYPTCPGCGSAGSFDPDQYLFRNFDVAATTDHLSRAIAMIQHINPDIRVILTVSPVALMATMEPRHVLQATTYSKSVLRVAAEQVARSFDCIDYFASYEIITGTANTQEYFGTDRRTVTQAGINHVMDVFFKLYAGSTDPTVALPAMLNEAKTEVTNSTPQRVCDEDDFFRALAAANYAQQHGNDQ